MVSEVGLISQLGRRLQWIIVSSHYEDRTNNRTVLAEMKTNKEMLAKMESNLKELKEEIMASKEEMKE
jgi:hypothetical protein